MDINRITPNESIQLHELITFKNLCLTKSIAMAPLCMDIELKALMQKDAMLNESHIKELRSFMNKSEIANLQ